MANSMMELDDDEDYEPLYHDGHWAWVDDQLQYVSHLEKAKSFIFPPETTSGTVDFKAQLDVLEQRRFQKRYQKKSDETSVVTLQDIKDLVLYTAPQHLVTVMLVNALHTPTTDRFLRALIFYCGYYLQVLDIMKSRTREREYKIPTENSKRIEEEYRENLSDLRILVGREYFAKISGSDTYNNFHHMGKNRNQQSQTKRDRFFYEALIPFSCQIVWIALSRREHTTLTVEINRLFRSTKYNWTERFYCFEQLKIMPPEVRSVMFGRCRPALRTRVAHTPLFEAIEGERDADYRMLGLGSIKYDNLDPRLKYLENILSVPESMFLELNINLGIIGLPRREYDIMLIKIPPAMVDGSSSLGGFKQSSRSATSRMSRLSNISRLSAKSITSKASKSKSVASIKLEEEIQKYKRFELPPKTEPGPLPEEFPSEPMKYLPVDKSQQGKWAIRAIVYQRKLACHLSKRHK